MERQREGHRKFIASSCLWTPGLACKLPPCSSDSRPLTQDWEQSTAQVPDWTLGGTHELGQNSPAEVLRPAPPGNHSPLMASGTTGLNLTRFKGKVKVTQSCLTLCNPMDYTVHGLLQVRILEWVAFPFSRGSSQSRGQTQVSLIAGWLPA